MIAPPPIQPIRGERYFRLDFGYLYFLELVDTQVIIRLRLCILTRRNESTRILCSWTKHFIEHESSRHLSNNVASFKDILILVHDLNSNDGTASNNHHPHNGSNLNSAPFVISQHTRVRTIPLTLWWDSNYGLRVNVDSVQVSNGRFLYPGNCPPGMGGAGGLVVSVLLQHYNTMYFH